MNSLVYSVRFTKSCQEGKEICGLLFWAPGSKRLSIWTISLIKALTFKHLKRAIYKELSRRQGDLWIVILGSRIKKSVNLDHFSNNSTHVQTFNNILNFMSGGGGEAGENRARNGEGREAGENIGKYRSIAFMWMVTLQRFVTEVMYCN